MSKMAQMLSGQELMVPVLWVSFDGLASSFLLASHCIPAVQIFRLHWEAFYLDDTHAL